MPRHGAGIDVVAAADVAADDEINRLAGVEIGRRGGRSRERADQRRSACVQQRPSRRHFQLPIDRAPVRAGIQPILQEMRERDQD
jgi:hypothetical protein